MCVFLKVCVSWLMSESKVCFFSKIELFLSGELHFDLNIGSLGNWVRSCGFVFRVSQRRGIISRNVFKQSRKTVILWQRCLQIFAFEMCLSYFECSASFCKRCEAFCILCVQFLDLCVKFCVCVNVCKQLKKIGCKIKTLKSQLYLP